MKIKRPTKPLILTFLILFSFMVSPISVANAGPLKWCELALEKAADKIISLPSRAKLLVMKAHPKYEEPRPWALSKQEQLLLRPDLVARYAATINTDLFEVSNVMEGMHGGHRLIIKRKGPWYDFRKDFTENGGDITQDLRAYPLAVGRESWFFGYRWLDADHVTIPDIAELNGAISKYNEGLPEGDPRRISTTYYDTEQNFVTGEQYVKNFVERNLVPIALNGRQFFHDISAHALEDFFVDNSLFTVARKRAKIWLDFISFVRDGHYNNGFTEAELNEANDPVMGKLGEQIDKLSMGMSEVLPQNSRIFLGEVGSQVIANSGKQQEYRDQGIIFSYFVNEKRAGVFIGLSTEDFPLLNKSVSGFYLKLIDNGRVNSAFKKYLSSYEKKEPDSFRGLPFDIDDQIKMVRNALAISDRSTRDQNLYQIPLTRLFVERVSYLRQLMGTD